MLSPFQHHRQLSDQARETSGSVARGAGLSGGRATNYDAGAPPGTSALVNQLRAELQRACEALDAGRADWRQKEAEHVSFLFPNWQSL